MLGIKLKIITVTLLLGSISATAIAADHKAVITHRQGIYTVMSGHMKVLKSILFQKHPLAADINYHATEILNAAQHHGNAFPEGSDKGRTNALPAIWENPEGFQKAGDDLGKALAIFIETTEIADMDDPEEMQAAYKDVGKTCKACHDDFRKERK